MKRNTPIKQKPFVYQDPLNEIKLVLQDVQTYLDNHIGFSKHTFDRLFKTKNPANSIALYSFLVYTAKWQKTDTPKAAATYIAKGLKWSESKVRRIKQELIKMGLVENKRVVDKKTKRVTGWYTKINYLKKPPCQNLMGGSHPVKIPQGGKKTAKCLLTNNINANKSKYHSPGSSTPGVKKRNPPKKKTKNIYLPIAKKLGKIISSHKKINCTTSIPSWTTPIRLLMTNDLKVKGTTTQEIKQRVLVALDFYKENIGGQYIPVIESGNSFRSKFIKLEAAMERSKEHTNENDIEYDDIPNKDNFPILEDNDIEDF